MEIAWQTVDGALDRIRKEVRIQREKSNTLCRQRTAHDWMQYKAEIERDDDQQEGTISYFWKAHTITVLLFLICCLVYVGVIETPSDDSDYNSRRGLLAAVFFWVFAGMTIMPDGPFLRPHPAIWRCAFAASIVYELMLIFMLFQSPNDARQLLKFFDEGLGEPIPERTYSENCLIYDASMPSNPFHNLWDKVDVFIFAHLFGYFCKTLIFRDWWLTTVISVMFEFLEYSLEHQLPNFSECWWDHWILDVIICNGGGTVLGLLTLRYLSLKTYNWRGIYNVPTYRGKIKRFIAQFTPYSWIEFTWNPLSSLERWVAVLGIVFMFLLTELNTFYLKFVLWWTPEHWINGLRLFFMLLWGSVCLRETFQLLDDPNCNKLGRQSWVLAAIIATEFLVCLKFGWDTLTKPIPRSVGTWWIAGVVLVVIYTVVKFIILKPTDLPRPETEKELLVNMTPVRRQKKKSREENGNILTRENGCQTEDGNPMSESEGKKFQ